MQANEPGNSERPPVYLLTGFLGSGKTTTLNAYLRDHGAAGTAVIVNEMADLGIDQALIQRIDDDLILLNSGCVCCTAKDDLVEALHQLVRRRRAGECPQFQRVVIEATGLADPSGVIHALLSDPRLMQTYSLAAVLALVDATHIFEQVERYPEATRQIVAADHLLISKTDLCDPGQAAAVSEQLHAMNPTAQQHVVTQGHFVDDKSATAGQALSLTAFKASTNVVEQSTQPLHSHDVATHVMELDGRVDWNKFCDWLQGVCLAKGRDLLRFKGIIYTTQNPEPLAVHAVHFAIYPPESIPGGNTLRGEVSRLVFIGHRLDPVVLRRTLETALRGGC